MIHRWPWLACVLALLVVGSRPSEAATAACDPDGVQQSGAVYRICVPAAWNGDLVVFAHGYVAFNEPVAIPEDQLALPDGTSLPSLVNTLGFAFATTSYRVNGLAVLPGIADLLDLVEVFKAAHGQARRVYLVGPSEGGLVTTLAIERHPDVFAGGVAACGPIGDFRAQINYNGDFRVVFDYFFPGVIPGDPVDVPPATIATFESEIAPAIRTSIRDNPDAARQLLAVTRAPVDPADVTTVEDTILGLAWYAVFASNDAAAKLGGVPYGNRLRNFVGADEDALLNASVRRVSADAAALTEMTRYQTTGRLARPLVTMHTSRDPIIPFWHAQLYSLKALLNGNFLKRHVNLRVNRYGHCRFEAPEVLAAFAIMVFMVEKQDVLAMQRALPDARARKAFRKLTSPHLVAH